MQSIGDNAMLHLVKVGGCGWEGEIRGFMLTQSAPPPKSP